MSAYVSAMSAHTSKCSQTSRVVPLSRTHVRYDDPRVELLSMFLHRCYLSITAHNGGGRIFMATNHTFLEHPKDPRIYSLCQIDIKRGPHFADLARKHSRAQTCPWTEQKTRNVCRHRLGPHCAGSTASHGLEKCPKIGSSNARSA